MKTILVPTDFSKNADCAVYYAAPVFAGDQCKFIIAHSFESEVSNLTSRIDIGKTEAVVDELYTSCELKCNAVKQQIIIDANNTNHTYQIIATSLSLPRAINKLILKEQVDFVIMGSKGSASVSSVLMGSNTLAMIQKIKNAPLLVIPDLFEFKPINVIAFATGFKRAYSENEVQPLVYISSLNKATIKLIHVHKKLKMTKEQLANFHELFELLREGNPENNWLPGETDVYDAITSYVNKEPIDLLAMIYYKHNPIARLFREATVKDIAKYAFIPFLILPTHD
jgi:nucleotide-binding universal stress UspA family protein